MNPARLTAAVLLVLGSFPLHAAAPAAPASDLLPAEKRRVTVELAQRLTRPPAPVPAPADLVSPFNPAGFEQPDPEEVRAAAADSAKAGGAGGVPAGGGEGAGPAQPVRQTGDRETLEAIAPRIMGTAMIEFAGKRMLLIGKNRFEVGAHFTVTYNGQEVDLELLAIDRTTFTLRLNHEEITRLIKPGKSP
ncbi:MAG: hypothetical protein EXS32_05365 [Opitutus sp.]|nr:hypothetical protein [Opitutus sp.]